MKGDETKLTVYRAGLCLDFHPFQDQREDQSTKVTADKRDLILELLFIFALGIKLQIKIQS